VSHLRGGVTGASANAHSGWIVKNRVGRDTRIETTGYTRGAVIHKLKSSYPIHPITLRNMVKRALEDQHRQVMTRIGAGEIVPPPSPSVPSQS
jgi:hypothetical protein